MCSISSALLDLQYYHQPIHLAYTVLQRGQTWQLWHPPLSFLHGKSQSTGIQNNTMIIRPGTGCVANTPTAENRTSQRAFRDPCFFRGLQTPCILMWDMVVVLLTGKKTREDMFSHYTAANITGPKGRLVKGSQLVPTQQRCHQQTCLKKVQTDPVKVTGVTKSCTDLRTVVLIETQASEQCLKYYV